eukprot:1606583-Pleurochrysis_carterae.AAC.5
MDPETPLQPISASCPPCGRPPFPDHTAARAHTPSARVKPACMRACVHACVGLCTWEAADEGGPQHEARHRLAQPTQDRVGACAG